ncbi:MAG: HEAT repeat domain-containing protein [Cyanobacteria bacterium NC_groundwater_1444_Ag_S-0.65um_54_12]|nr:HEAT repeat domain-containing protein [Cyanobacteria bacterium NC_groundwater_1444_Ag_S-0.65um_54_12]
MNAGILSLLSQLTSLDPVIQRRGLQEAQELEPGPDSVKLRTLLWQLGGASPFREIRIAALKALRIHDPESSEALRLLVDLYALTKKTRTLSHQLEHDKATLLKKLGKPAFTKIATLLLPLAWEGTEAFRRSVIAAIGDMANSTIAPQLIPLLFSTSAIVRSETAIAWDRCEGLFGVTDRFKEMIGLEKEEARIKRRLIDIKQRYTKKELLAAQQICLFWEQPARRGEVITAWLAGEAPENLIAYLLVSLVDKRGGIHEVAHQAFLKIGPSAIGPLCSALHDADWLVRKLAAEILGDLGNPVASEPLMIALEDTKPLVARAVALALGQLRATKALQPLSKALQHSDPLVAKAAQSALNRIKGQETTP